MEVEEFIKNLDVLEEWFVKGIVNLNDYFKIKSNLCDVFNKKEYKLSKDTLPF